MDPRDASAYKNYINIFYLRKLGKAKMISSLPQLMATLGNQLYTHPNFVFLDRSIIIGTMGPIM